MFQWIRDIIITVDTRKKARERIWSSFYSTIAFYHTSQRLQIYELDLSSYELFRSTLLEKPAQIIQVILGAIITHQDRPRVAGKYQPYCRCVCWCYSYLHKSRKEFQTEASTLAPGPSESFFSATYALTGIDGIKLGNLLDSAVFRWRGRDQL
jgi:hypothetical protein